MSVEFGTGLTIRSSDWTTFKGYVTSGKIVRVQYDDDGVIYKIFGYDDGEVCTCTIWKGAVPDGVIAGGYTQAQNDADKADFEANYQATANQPIEPRNIDGIPLGSAEPRIGTELVAITHNFCDPTTWYTQSVRVTGEGLSDIGGGVTWSSTNSPWIDMTHGKIFDEDAICEEVAHGYSVRVYVNGVEKTPRAPFATSGGDYTVDYKAGRVTFSSSQIGQTVTADYSYANGSEWRLVPDAGKRIDIEDAEVQFSTDVVLNDSVEFDVWVYNPADLPNKILYDRTTYKTYANYVDEARGAYPVLVTAGGPTRGILSTWQGFPFRYETIRILRSSQGVEIRVRLKNGQVFGGEHTTGTFYCTTREE